MRFLPPDYSVVISTNSVKVFHCDELLTTFLFDNLKSLYPYNLDECIDFAYDRIEEHRSNDEG